MTATRVLALEGVNNFRDYGDYAVSGGGRIRRGALWRSGQHVGASDADLDVIAGLGLTTVTDLRGDSERRLNPCRRHASFTAQVLTCDGESAALASHIDAAKGVLTEADARGAMRRLYAEMPYRANLVAVLQRHFAALAEDGVSLIHCFAGKDRTGLSVALTHHVLGVHPDDVMADYLLTNTVMAGRDFQGKSGSDASKYQRMDEATSQALRGVKPEYLAEGLAAIQASHGSTDAYLADVLAVDAAMQEKIRAALIR
ncbi:tyrosine-protein phosphatase [Novosphingobium sp. JCM 18896]|uniref:tyrosine-protein phosphatase n=1 Tax=Novosphingobium sp. JCM 18896 TaxID=2989731 RepID=UPI002223A7E8|nr:tyrosine-protein phosphatase [Novosphingobium sp. JCM 18896]MCW1428139.1 tyrosine-protein phosphatase [Novosphingobium sp. JCM 18896]